MTLTLDTRAPIVVLVAQFNPAIFQPAWIARHLFDKAEGEDMQFLEMIAQNGQRVIQLSFFEGVAFLVTPDRTDIFAVDARPETFANVENVLLKMLSVLPHTPVMAIGCNLNYVDDNPNSMVEDLFETREALEGEGKLNLRQSGVQLQMDGPEVLNFNRIMTEQNVSFNFNYHRPEPDISRYGDFVPGMIQRALDHSQSILKSYYGYEAFEAVGFLAEAKLEEGANVVESTN
ncbi:hypothetical protein [Sphingobium sp. Sx8-8]|uniref:hypothetical protein n=1 Tax=Sphingobium sp. Sx8-8 TaxID=2933617 RepID=UPI001F57894B|nr:hypothetical protein [Sphingobium sp. Sx8-8]